MKTKTFGSKADMTQYRRGMGVTTGRLCLILITGLLAFLDSASPASALPVALLSARNPAVPLPAGGDGNSAAPVVSADGRYVIFTSTANDLVPGGNSFYSLNVFLQDRTGNTTTLVSSNMTGTGGGNGNSMLGQVSTNGQYVVFQSDASNLVPNDTNGATDIFVRDLVAGTTTLVSVSTNGGSANGASTDPVMTPDGRYVAFISSASNLVPGDANGISDVFVRDLVVGTNYLVSVGALSPAGYSMSSFMTTPAITPDGRYVAFFSLATNLVSGVPRTSQGEVYLADRSTGTMTWVSTNTAAIVSTSLGLGAVPAFHPRLSDDGRYVAFKAGRIGTNGPAAILEYDAVAATTTLINTNGIGWSTALDDSYGPEMTPDGRFVAFVRAESTTNSPYCSVHVWDNQSATDTLVSDDGSGVPTNTISYMPVISTNGQFVAFLSNATNLVGNTVSNGAHIYLRNLQTSSTQLVDADTNGVGSTDDGLTSLSMSANGQFVAFSSPDGSLVNLDVNRADDVFVCDLIAGITGMVSQRNATVIPQAGDGFSALSQGSLSADGRWAAFSSVADDLVINDTNQTRDVFVRDSDNETNLLVSVGVNGGAALGGASTSPLISTNGRYVIFLSAATNLVTGPVNKYNNVFRRDLQAGTTILCSVGTDGISPGNDDAFDPVISSDGQCVAFSSPASNLAAGLTSGLNTYWRNLNLGQTVGLKGANYFAFDPSLSGDGRYIAYAFGVTATTTRLQIRDTQLGTDIYTNSGAVTSAAIDPTGTKIAYRIANTLFVDSIVSRSNLFSMSTLCPIRSANCWSDNGRWLTFVSSTNLAAADDGTNKVYLMDFQTGTLTLVGLAGPGTGSAEALSDAPTISGNGRFIAYRSVVINTVIGDTSAPPNIFLLDRLAGSNSVMNIGQNSYGPLSWVSRPAISDSGATTAFLNQDSGLVPGDINREPDAFGAAANLSATPPVITNFLVEVGSGGISTGGGSGNSATNTISLFWPAIVGTSYQIQYTTNLSQPMWLPAPGNIWVMGSQAYYSVPMLQPQMFYRVATIP